MTKNRWGTFGRGGRLRRSVALTAALIAAMLATQPDGQAATGDALPFSKSYTVTGNYAAAGVDLNPSLAQNGFITGTISMSGANSVPAGAEILAAFLYWETVTSNTTPGEGARFRGQDIPFLTKTSALLDPTTAPCFSSGAGTGPYTMTMIQADVLGLLPPQLDEDGNPTGRRLVNDADLLANGLPLHTVTLPQTGTGNVVPRSAGASLLVVYRAPAEPLRTIVVYDGAFIEQGSGMTQTIGGFLQSSGSRSARLTHIVGTGAPNRTETLAFDNLRTTPSRLATNAFVGSATSSSDRGWSTLTYDVSASMPGSNANDGYGERVRTTVTHGNASPYDCLAWAAIVFSTTVQDTDGDGLVDLLEDVSGLKDPAGAAYPDIHAMGASPGHKDLFIEVNRMVAEGPTTYGSADAPYSATVDRIQDNDGHDHMPTPAVWKMLGDAFRNAPVSNPDSTNGINLHVDVGPGYHALGPAYTSNEADQYLITAPDLARGGESIPEVHCDPEQPAPCQFPDFPGTVSWKLGFSMLRDAWIDAGGRELSREEAAGCTEPEDCRKRFDPLRNHIFHYFLYAHARGVPKSPYPCLDAEGAPTSLQSDKTCAVARNPLFHVPRGISGVADLPGNNGMITLGFGEDFVGTEFFQASTTMHELGHNLELWHGGLAPRYTSLPNGRVRAYVEPQCKPNHLTVMSYLYQMRGLLDGVGAPHVNYSGSALGLVNSVVDETALFDAPLTPGPVPYRTAWYAPLAPGTIGTTLGLQPVRRHCDGSPLLLDANGVPVEPAMGRLETERVDQIIDWNGNGGADAGVWQDVNFDGRLNGVFGDPAAPLKAADDWINLRLNQLGGGRNPAGFSTGSVYITGTPYIDGTPIQGTPYIDGTPYTDGTPYIDGTPYTDGTPYIDGTPYTDGSVYFAGTPYTDGTPYIDGSDEVTQRGGLELGDDLIADLGYAPPNQLAGCVIGGSGTAACAPESGPLHRHRVSWARPNVGSVDEYSVRRATGDQIVQGATLVTVGSTVSETLVDTEELPHGIAFTYLASARFADGRTSGPSNFARVTAENAAPVANPDSYTVRRNRTLVVGETTGVLDNDTDADSPEPSWRVVLVTPPVNGVLVLNEDGSFTYTPANGFAGTDSFTYKVTPGFWTRDSSIPMSPDSAPGTVTIQVTSR